MEERSRFLPRYVVPGKRTYTQFQYEVREFAAKLHAEGKAWKGEAFGWQAEYNPERPEPPLDSKMTFTPADFCIGESGIWFFSLMWEHGSNAEPVAFLDDKNIVEKIA